MASSTSAAPRSSAAAAHTIGTRRAAQRRRVQRPADLVVGELGAAEVLLDERVVGLRGGVDERAVGALHLGAHRLGEVGVARPAAGLELVRAVVDEVDVAGEVAGAADRHRHGDGLAVEGVAERVDGRLVRRVLLVHLVDHDQGGQVARGDHLPGQLGADRHAPAGADHQHRGVGGGERRGELAGEVLEPGNVDEVDAVPVPVEVGERGADAHRAALLLGLVVEDRGALVGGAHPGGGPGGVQQRLAEGGLAVVAVTDHGDGPDPIRRGHRHGQELPVTVADAR